jgi:hypothetical protein
MPPKREPQSASAPGEPLPLDRALEVGDSFLLRAHVSAASCAARVCLLCRD